MTNKRRAVLHDFDLKSLKNPWISIRRLLVDDFFSRRVALLNEYDLILDLGGIKNAKKGRFNIDLLNLQVIYGNYEYKSDPDICLDAQELPLESNTFDCVICSEVIEHIGQPHLALTEIFRVLKPGGLLLLSSPFLYPIHGDPADYGRYTGQYYNDQLKSIGFEGINIEMHGGFWCVFAEMVRGWSMEKEQQLSGVREKMLNWLNVNLQPWMKKKAVIADHKNCDKGGFFIKGCTTGFGVVCLKPPCI